MKLLTARHSNLATWVDEKKTLRAVQAFEKASGKKVNHKIVPRRGGDSTAVYAATETAEKELGWKSKLDVNDMCRDQWAWASVSTKLEPPESPCLDREHIQIWLPWPSFCSMY